ncbi:uncharacterized protein G2W53_007391 [Senna tora]|uniref:Uncharacterized protein n=1 Tax=Senna tora TaxID=362788 RepID=A0A834X713_9FABA|nr:uncharacterized protein G2W53_007391 [Senna tora]
MVEEKGEVFVSKELGTWMRADRSGRKVTWMRADRSGRKVTWPGTSKATHDNGHGGEVHRVGRIKKVDTEELLNKLACMTVRE